jgi:hypothetical protein
LERAVDAGVLMQHQSFPFPYIDPAFTESSLDGAMLTQVAVGEHQIQLRWHNGVTILCESDIVVTEKDGTIHKISSGDEASPLLPFIGRDAVAMQLKDRQFLHVDLDDGSSIRVLVEDSGHESFQVMVGDEWVLIW